MESHPSSQNDVCCPDSLTSDSSSCPPHSTTHTTVTRPLSVPHRKQRHTRISRLDYESPESSINQSEFRGFLNLFNLSVGMFLISDPLLRYIETGRFIDPSLAEAMFEDAFLLLLNWLQCFLWSFTPFLVYRAFAAGYLGTLSVRMLQHFTQSLMLGYSVALCIYQNWPILPCGFTLIISVISLMKMHSFTETQLEVHYMRERLKQGFDDSKTTTTKPSLFPSPSPSVVQTQSTESVSDDHSTAASTHDGSVSQVALRSSRDDELSRRGSSYGVPRCSVPRTPVPVSGPALSLEKRRLSDTRNELQDNDTPSLRYYCYYLFCPALVYEPHYPRGPPFRPYYFISKLISLFAAMVALYFISTRYLTPMMKATIGKPVLLMFIKLLWPMLFCYLLVFFILFECICNLLAEITSFGDRDFYHDWWNSTTFDEFSRKWNRPVHEFLLRHVYYKSLSGFRFSKFQATFTTFFFSALLHELIMAVCFKAIRFWMFGLMMLQIPLIAIGQYHKGTDLGNIFFWAAMGVGLPLLTIAYGREYIIRQSELIA